MPSPSTFKTECQFCGIIVKDKREVLKDIALIGFPTYGLYHDITIFYLMLPRILAREQPGRLNPAKFALGRPLPELQNIHISSMRFWQNLLNPYCFSTNIAVLKSNC